MIRVAILSDVHAGEATVDGTFVVAEPPPSPVNENPLRDLHHFVGAAGIRADFLLCPGDLGNQANTVGRRYGWDMLRDIAVSVGASEPIGTVGNHDLETRSPIPDPAVLLKSLSPRFPSENPAHNNRYWADGFYLDDSLPNLRILNINSCADFPDHPGPTGTTRQKGAYKKAVQRGSISRGRIRAIEDELMGLDEKPVNLVLLHHHPVEHARRHPFRDSYGPMANGGEFIEMLERNRQCGRWMVIHGHKHIPNFTVDGGSANSPLVLCAGSVGGQLWQPVASATRNQFHVVEFETERVMGLPITRGFVKSWSWSFGTGWREAPPTTGLPSSFGFGSLHDSRDLADQVVARMVAQGAELMMWSEIESALPLVRYLSPIDMTIFEERLESFDYLVERFKGFTISRIARSASW